MEAHVSRISRVVCIPRVLCGTVGPLSFCTVATLYTLMELIRHADTDASRQLMLTSISNLVVSYDETLKCFIMTWSHQDEFISVVINAFEPHHCSPPYCPRDAQSVTLRRLVVEDDDRHTSHGQVLR